MPDDERTEALQWAQTANTMTPSIGKVLSGKDARTIMAYAGAPVDPAEELEPPEPAMDPEDQMEPPETPGEPPDPEDQAEPPEPAPPAA